MVLQSVTFLCLLENFIIHHHHYQRVIRTKEVAMHIHKGFTVAENAVTLIICPFWLRMCNHLIRH